MQKRGRRNNILIQTRGLLFIWMLFTADTLFGQMSVTLNGGYGSFAMADMKAVQQTLVKAFPIPPKVTSSFPSYYCYDLHLLRTLPSGLIIGSSLGYGSSGGRVYYSDYTGDLGSDQLVSYYSVSLIVGGFTDSKNKKYRFTYDARPGVTFNHAQITTYTSLSTATDQISFTGKNINLQPTFTLTRRFANLGASVYAGYLISLVQGKMTNGQAYLIKDNQSEAHLDWSGYRVGLGFSIYLE